MQSGMPRWRMRATGTKPSARSASVVGQTQIRAPASRSRSSSRPSAWVAWTTVVRSEAPLARQQLDRAEAVLEQALVDLARLLVSVDVQRQTLLGGVAAELAQRGRRACADGVRSDADRDALGAELLERAEVLRHRLLAKPRGAAAEVRGVEADECDPGLRGRRRGGTRLLEAEVVELADGRVPRREHLLVHEPVLAPDLGRGQRLGELDHAVAPRPEVRSTAAAAERPLERVGVGVDETVDRERRHRARRYQRSLWKDPDLVRGDLWYRNAIVYCLYVETFMDANGDGIGDFEGLSRRLDYLESLGVDVLWLAPFQPTPEPRRRLRHHRLLRRRPALRHARRLRRVHRTRRSSRGIRVSSTSSSTTPPTSTRGSVDARARPRTRRTATGTCGRRSGRRTGTSGMVFPGVQKTTWTFGREARRVLLPPLLRLPARPEHGQPARARGDPADHRASGCSSASPASASTPCRSSSRSRRRAAARPRRVRVPARAPRRSLQWRVGDAVLLGEANVVPRRDAEYFARRRRAAHDVQLLGQPAPVLRARVRRRAAARGRRCARRGGIPATRAVGALPAQPRRARPRPADRRAARRRSSSGSGPSRAMQLYDRGIRRRLAPMLGDRAPDRARLQPAVLAARDARPPLRRRDRHGRGPRAPASATRSARRCSGRPSRTPASRPPRSSCGRSSTRRALRLRDVNVERQRRDAASLLRWTTRMIRLRKECPEIGWGAWRILPTRAAARARAPATTGAATRSSASTTSPIARRR